MKVIDLIDRCLCCDDTLPRKIIYKGKEFALKTNNPFPHFYDTDKGVNFMSVIEYFQDLEEDVEIVEVLEEEKEIEVLCIELLGQCDNWLQKRDVNIKSDFELNPYILEAINRNFKSLYDKQCELIKSINELKKGK